MNEDFDNFVLPYGISKRLIPDGIEITRRWGFGFSHAFICVIGLCLLIYMIVARPALILTILGVLLVLAIFCYGLTRMFNQTVITVTSETIVVQSGPLFSGGKIVLPTNDIVGFTWKKFDRSYSRYQCDSYSVSASLRGKRQFFLDNFEMLEQAQYLCAELEKAYARSKT